MHDVIEHPHISHRSIGDFAWTLPLFGVVLITASAIASLLTGSITPDVIGADGLSGSMMMVP